MYVLFSAIFSCSGFVLAFSGATNIEAFPVLDAHQMTFDARPGFHIVHFPLFSVRLLSQNLCLERVGRI